VENRSCFIGLKSQPSKLKHCISTDYLEVVPESCKHQRWPVRISRGTTTSVTFSCPFNLNLLTCPHQVPSNPHALTPVTTTFNLVSLTSAFKHKDVVISTISGGDVSFQKLLINNEFSHITQNPRLCERFPQCQARAEVLQYLKKKSREHKKFSWTGLAMGCLIEEGLKGGLLGFDLRWSSALVYESGRESFACSTLRGVGETVRKS